MHFGVACSASVVGVGVVSISVVFFKEHVGAPSAEAGRQKTQQHAHSLHRHLCSEYRLLVLDLILVTYFFGQAPSRPLAL